MKEEEEINYVLFYLDQRQRVASPNGEDMEKHFNDAKSFIQSSTTKDGVNL